VTHRLAGWSAGTLLVVLLALVQVVDIGSRALAPWLAKARAAALRFLALPAAPSPLNATACWLLVSIALAAVALAWGYDAASGGMLLAGGSAPKVPPPPGPTAQEIAIQEEQVKVLRAQVAALERQNAIQEAIPTAEISGAIRDQIAVAREQLKLAQEEAIRARERAPREQAVALRQLQVAERQLQLAERGMTIQDALQPFVLASMRLVEEPGGAIRRMTEDEYVGTLSPQERLAYDNTTLALQREAKALRGDLPLSAAGQQRKRDEFAAFREQMARGGNPIEGDDPATATASTTPGVQLLRAFNERWAVAEEAERRGQLTEGSQTVLARLGVASDLGVRTREGLLTATRGVAVPTTYFGGVSAASRAGVPPIGAVGALSPPDFAGALAPYQRIRELGYDRGRVNAQLQAQSDAATMQGAGALTGALLGAGATIGAAALMVSSRDAKKDVRRATRREEDRALEMVRDLKTHTFRYRGEPSRAPRRLGVMADEVPAEIATPDRRGVDVGRLTGMLVGATRALARREAARRRGRRGMLPTKGDAR
jgi:outer membrane murein-binding lipoprotein Lpp